MATKTHKPGCAKAAAMEKLRKASLGAITAVGKAAGGKRRAYDVAQTTADETKCTCAKSAGRGWLGKAREAETIRVMKAVGVYHSKDGS